MRDKNIIKRTAATAGRAAVFLLLFWIPLSAGAATLRVDADGVGDYATIAEAVAAGTSVDTVLVAPGIYGGQDCGCPGILTCVIAFNDCQGAVGCTEYTEPTVRSCVIYGNTGDDDICGVCSDNFFVDPLLCDVAVGDVSPCEDSPCLGADTPDGTTVGAYRVAGCGPCGDTPVKDTSWGAVKASWR